ncbi:hypothetical protein D1872_262330 [compost metagenome]
MKKESSRSLFWVIFPFLTAEEHGDDHVELIRRLNGLSGRYFTPRSQIRHNRPPYDRSPIA